MEWTKEMEWTNLPAFEAVGLKWSGTFAEAEAGAIRDVQAELHRRLTTIEGTEAPDEMLGLSYHVSENGFTHYAAVRVREGSPVPEGMEKISVPALRYASCSHRPGDEIEASYHRIYDWIERNGAAAKSAQGLTHFEIYPMSQNPHTDEPAFRILIPVETTA